MRAVRERPRIAALTAVAAVCLLACGVAAGLLVGEGTEATVEPAPQLVRAEAASRAEREQLRTELAKARNTAADCKRRTRAAARVRSALVDRLERARTALRKERR